MKDYIQHAMKTCSPQFNTELVPTNVLHGMIGMTTEAGELADAGKKALFYGKPLDAANIKEECGDILWYMACILDHYGWTFDEVMQTNIAKLENARYKKGFTSEEALNRDLPAERKILEANLDRFESKEEPQLSADQRQQMEKLKEANRREASHGEPTY